MTSASVALRTGWCASWTVRSWRSRGWGCAMFSRVTQLEIDLMRTSVAGALRVFADQVMPELQTQPGYEGVYVFASEEGRGMVVTFWDSAAAAEEGVDDGWYAGALEAHVTLFRSPPGRERYEVLV